MSPEERAEFERTAIGQLERFRSEWHKLVAAIKRALKL